MMDEIFKDFLKLLNIKKEANHEIDRDIFDFCEKYPENTEIIYCSNETFSSSLILLLKESDSIRKLVYFDQHAKEPVIINFSKEKFKKMIEKLNSLK